MGDETRMLTPLVETEMMTPGGVKELRGILERLEQASTGKLALKAVQQANFLREVLATILTGKRGLKKLGLLRLKPLSRRQQLGVRYAIHEAVTHGVELLVCDHPGLRKERKAEEQKRKAETSATTGAPCPTCGRLVEGMVVRAVFLRALKQKEKALALIADFKMPKKGLPSGKSR